MNNFAEINSDVVSACIDYPESVTLIFASHKRPGGGYKNHENGQEEYFARRSNLVSLLRKFKHMYGSNQKYFVILLSNVIVEADVNEVGFVERDVIVCPAPVANLYDNPDEEIEKRIKDICDAVKDYKTFITGPFGCGFFGNDEQIVKKLFKKYSTNKTVIWVNYEKSTN